MNSYPDKPWDTQIPIDRVHRIGLIRQGPIDNTGDVVCRLHYYRVKEEVLCLAWQKSSFDFDGTDVSILPDLSRWTFMMRGMLRFLLELVISHNASYR